MNILIVDDNPDISEALYEILGIHGYKSVKTAKNVQEATGLLEHWNVDVVVSDLLMPKVNGLEFYKQVSKRPYPPKFILITGADLNDIQHDENDRHLTILQKPFSSHLLVALIGSLKHKIQKPEPQPTQGFPNVS